MLAERAAPSAHTSGSARRQSEKALDRDERLRDGRSAITALRTIQLAVGGARYDHKRAVRMPRCSPRNELVQYCARE